MCNGPLHNGPLHNGPLHNGPLHNGPLHNGPLHNGPQALMSESRLCYRYVCLCGRHARIELRAMHRQRVRLAPVFGTVFAVYRQRSTLGRR